MAVTFLIPGPLRAFADGQSAVTMGERSETVGEALGTLCRRYPGIRDRVVTEQGLVREHVNVFVGTEDIRFTGGLQTPVADGAEISILPAISGGMETGLT